MKAIQIKYINATATRGPRLKAFTDAGSMIESYEYTDIEKQAYELAKTYAHLAFNIAITGFGVLPNGDYVATLWSK